MRSCAPLSTCLHVLLFEVFVCSLARLCLSDCTYSFAPVSKCLLVLMRNCDYMIVHNLVRLCRSFCVYSCAPVSNRLYVILFARLLSVCMKSGATVSKSFYALLHTCV